MAIADLTAVQYNQLKKFTRADTTPKRAIYKYPWRPNAWLMT